MNTINYQTFNEIPKRFLCLQCFNFPKIPVKCISMYCQAMYCLYCKNDMQKKNIKCKKCKYQIPHKQIDVISQYVMASMQIICANCKRQIKASKYQKHQNYCHQNNIQQELEYFKHIQKQIDKIQVIICSYCNKKRGFQEFLIISFDGVQLFKQHLNLCQCVKFQKLPQEDTIQLFIQNNFECDYCHNYIIFQDLIHHFYVCQFSLTNCQVKACQWRNKRSLFRSHFINCLNKRQQIISSTDKLMEKVLKCEEMQLDSIRRKMEEIDKNKNRILNLTFLNDRQKTESIISSPQDDRYIF